MPTCGYICPVCEGSEFFEGKPCYHCNKEKFKEHLLSNRSDKSNPNHSSKGKDA